MVPGGEAKTLHSKTQEKDHANVQKREPEQEKREAAQADGIWHQKLCTQQEELGLIWKRREHTQEDRPVFPNTMGLVKGSNLN